MIRQRRAGGSCANSKRYTVLCASNLQRLSAGPACGQLDQIAKVLGTRRLRGARSRLAAAETATSLSERLAALGLCPFRPAHKRLLGETLATRLLGVWPACAARLATIIGGLTGCLGPFARIPLRVRLAKMIGSDRQLHADHALDLA